MRVSVHELILEAIQRFCEVDGKLLSSARLLFTRPGLLTKHYIEGKRVRYLRPITLFALATALLFLVIEWNASKSVTLSEISTPVGEYVSVQLLPAMSVTLHEEFLEEIEAAPKEGTQAYLESLDITPGTSQWFLAERSLWILGRDGISGFRQQVARAASRSIAVLVPVLAFVVAAVHRRRKLYFAESLVYCLHWHSFLFFVFALAYVLPSGISRTTAIAVCCLVGVVYTVISLRVAFGNSWLAASIKSAVILVTHMAFVLAATMALVLLVFVFA
ncbi:MAG: hypothetical protein Aurels2KO_47890 [Aureliella sp.]